MRAMLNLPPANRPPLGKGPTGKDKVRSYPSRANTPLLSEYPTRTRDASPSTARTGSSTPSSVIHTDGVASHSADNGVQEPHWDTAIVVPVSEGDAHIHQPSFLPTTYTHTHRVLVDHGSPSSPTNARPLFTPSSFIPTSHHFDRPLSSVASWSNNSMHRDERFPYSTTTSTTSAMNFSSENHVRLTAPTTSANNTHALDDSVSGHDLPHSHNLGYGLRRSITDGSYPVDHSPHVPYPLQTPSPLRVPHTSRPPPNRLSHSPDYGP